MIVRRTEAGTSWQELAALDPLAAVLDPADRAGRKNRFIDRLHKRALGSAVGQVSGKAVLDFGCGTGRLSEWLVEHGAHLDGVDVTPEMVVVAERRVPRGRFQTIDGLTLPFADDQFDLVVTAYVLQYYVESDGLIPRELARVLRQDGRFIAIEQVTDGDLGRGGTRAAYERMFIAAGFNALDVRPIRISDSPIIRVAHRFPALSRMPLVPWLAGKEATRRARRQLRNGRYADVLFCAAKE